MTKATKIEGFDCPTAGRDVMITKTIIEHKSSRGSHLEPDKQLIRYEDCDYKTQCGVQADATSLPDWPRCVHPSLSKKNAK